MANVVWLSLRTQTPPRSYWDQSLLEHLLKGCNHFYSVDSALEIDDEAIVVIPGAYQGYLIKEINAELAKLKSCKVIVTSDENNNFPIDELEHPNMKLYATYPNEKYKAEVVWLPIGPAKMRENTLPTKDLEWFFSGQVTHTDRKECVKVLDTMDKGKLIKTKGFAKGLPQDEYYSYMDRAKFVPCPDGVVNPDSFRLYEALEAGSIPIPRTHGNFWNNLLGYVPFPTVEEWDDLPKEIEATDDRLPNECFAWWQRKKLDIKSSLVEDNHITAVIPVSPIKSHPSTDMIDETIDSIRKHLPHSKIVVTFDGVREEQADRADDYHEFIRRFLHKYNNQNVYPIIFPHHTHQVGMAREALKHITSHLLLYVEHDTPLVDEEIPFSEMSHTISKGALDLVRLHFETRIPDEHLHMMLDEEPIWLGIPVVRTCQWSQRPHLSSRAFYDRIIKDCFSPDALSFIEDKMHGVCANSYQEFGVFGWNNYKLGIYHPEGSIKRSYNLDGRGDEQKWDESQVF